MEKQLTYQHSTHRQCKEKESASEMTVCIRLARDNDLKIHKPNELNRLTLFPLIVMLYNCNTWSNVNKYTIYKHNF